MPVDTHTDQALPVMLVGRPVNRMQFGSKRRRHNWLGISVWPSVVPGHFQNWSMRDRVEGVKKSVDQYRTGGLGEASRTVWWGLSLPWTLPRGARVALKKAKL